MFENISKKIKIIAEILALVGMITSLVIGLIIIIAGIRADMGGESVLIVLGGVLFAVIGCFFSWVGVFFIYGFGQLIENTDTLVAIAKGKKVDETPILNVDEASEQEREAKPDSSQNEEIACAEKEKIGSDDILTWTVLGIAVVALLLGIIFAFI